VTVSLATVRITIELPADGDETDPYAAADRFLTWLPRGILIAAVVAAEITQPEVTS
jgi:hypothetical protein